VAPIECASSHRGQLRGSQRKISEAEGQSPQQLGLQQKNAALADKTDAALPVTISPAVPLLKKTACAMQVTTDKVSTHGYELMYGLFLLPLLKARQRPKLLEIGLGCSMRYGAGASAQLWRRALPTSEIWEAEVDAACVSRHADSLRAQRINVLIGQQGNVTTLHQWVDESGGNFDAIIDDGSHTSEHILTSLGVLWNALVPGGVYFMEDLGWSTEMSLRQEVNGKRTTYFVSEVLQSWLEVQFYPSHLQANRTLQGLPPPPRGLDFIFCQRHACVLGKKNNMSDIDVDAPQPPRPNRCEGAKSRAGNQSKAATKLLWQDRNRRKRKFVAWAPALKV